MRNNLFWKMCLIIATGVVVLFWIIDLATSSTEKGMSFIDPQYREQITLWGKEAERLYTSENPQRLEAWLEDLGKRENTWVSVAQTNLKKVAGKALLPSYYQGHLMGRSVDWQIHLYMERNPVMEVPFVNDETRFLIQLPDRMRPGKNLETARLSLQIIVPMVLLLVVCILLYRHIMNPLRKLQQATQSFSKGDFDVRAGDLLGNRQDEFSELASTFDQMATRIGTQIISQRQLIADISHELRTPLTRLDISVQNLAHNKDKQLNLERIQRESKSIRQLVDDSLTLAWLENECPELQQESIDLTDLLDVLIEDARFEYPNRKLELDLPNSAEIHNSNHRCLGQALENILRNALSFTPENKRVSVTMTECEAHFTIMVQDQGSGVPAADLQRIFDPFFRSDANRQDSRSGYGLGLALAKRQIDAVGGVVKAFNKLEGGLFMNIDLPKYRTG